MSKGTIDQYRTPEGEAELQVQRFVARTERKRRNYNRYVRRYARIRAQRA